MSLNRINLTHNFILSTFVVIIIGIVNIIYPILIGLMYLPETMGNFSVIISWVSFVSIPIINGIAPTTSRFIAANSNSKRNIIFTSGVKISIYYMLFALLLIPLIGIFVFSLSFFDILFILILLFGILFHYLFRHSLQGQEKFKELFIIEILSFIIFIISLLFFTILPYFLNWSSMQNFYLLFIPILIYHLSFDVIFIIIHWKQFSLKGFFVFPDLIKNFLKYAALVGVGSFLNLGINQIQIIISDLHLSDFEVGELGFWNSAIASISLISIALSSIIVPRITKLLKNNSNVEKPFVNSINWALILCILPIFGLLLILIGAYPGFLDKLTLSKYQMETYWLIPILLCFQIINSLLTAPTICYFSASENYVKYNSITSFIYSIFVIISWIILVPLIGIFGFAAGLAIGAFVFGLSVQIIALVITKKQIGMHFIILNIIYILIGLSIFLLNYIPSIVLIIIWSIPILPSLFFGIKKIVGIVKNESYSIIPSENNNVENNT